MARKDAAAIRQGMLGGAVDEMLSQVVGERITCQSCDESFMVTAENLYGVSIDDEDTDDVIRWPVDDSGTEWKLFIVCDEQKHALRVDKWMDEIPPVVKRYP